MDRTLKAHIQSQLESTLVPIKAYMHDAEVQEIMINAPGQVFIERRGVKERIQADLSASQIESAIRLLAKLNGKDAKAGTLDGLVNARMDGFRIAAVMAPTSTAGHSICIRKHSTIHKSMADYVNEGRVTPEMAELMRLMIVERRNIIVAGGTSSGKTTFLNALLAMIDPDDRVLTIEDTKELQVLVENWASWESNEQEGVTIQELVKHSLRFRPDRIIVGEVRGKEAFDLMQLANTGHDGCVATLHASSAAKAMTRLEGMVLQAGVDWPHHAVKQYIAETFHNVVYLERKNGFRMVSEVMEIQGYDPVTHEYRINKLYVANKGDGKHG